DIDPEEALPAAVPDRTFAEKSALSDLVEWRIGADDAFEFRRGRVEFHWRAPSLACRTGVPHYCPEWRSCLRRSASSREYMIDRMLLPRNRMVAADDDLAGTDLRHQMAERFRREYECIEIELFEIVARPLLQLDVRVAILWRDEASVVAARRVG